MKKMKPVKHTNVFLVDCLDGKRYCVPYTNKDKVNLLLRLTEQLNTACIFDNYKLVWTKSEGYGNYLWHETEPYHEIEYTSIDNVGDVMLYAFNVMMENQFNVCVVGDKVITMLDASKYVSVKNFLEDIDNQ